jgi:ABC-type branched-subunit amino acid transport system ATPase component
MLVARDLSIRFGGVAALQQVSLTVEARRIVGLIGPNGAGKTTLFALLSGFLRPESGSIAFQSRDIAGLPPHAICRLGMTRTFQIVQPSPARRCATTSPSARICTTAAGRLRSAPRRTSLRAWGSPPSSTSSPPI